MLEQAVRRSVVDAVVIDPQVDGTVCLAEIRRLLEGYPGMPVVVYTPLSPTSLKVVVELAQYGLHHVVLHRFDDEPRRFRDLLDRLAGDALSDSLLEQLSAPLGRLPAGTARAIERLFGAPHRFFGAPDLAAEAGVAVRKLYRQLAAAGLSSPRIVVQGARLLRAFSYLQNPQCLVEDAAGKLGYSAPRVLSSQIREVTGLRPTEWRQRMSGEELVCLLTRRLSVELVCRESSARAAQRNGSGE